MGQNCWPMLAPKKLRQKSTQNDRVWGADFHMRGALDKQLLWNSETKNKGMGKTTGLTGCTVNWYLHKSSQIGRCLIHMTWIALIQKRGVYRGMCILKWWIGSQWLTGVHPIRIMVNSNHFGLKAHPFIIIVGMIYSWVYMGLPH